MNRVWLRRFGQVGVLALTLTFRLGLSSAPEAGATASGCGLWGNNRTPEARRRQTRRRRIALAMVEEAMEVGAGIACLRSATRPTSCPGSP